MKNNGNLVVIMLVVAIIIAVGATSLNLSKVSFISGMAAAGAEFKGISAVTPTQGETYTVNTLDLELVADGYNTVSDEDCYKNTNGTGSPMPSVHTTVCGGNLSISTYNVSVVSNAKHNWSVRFDNATGTTGWLTGATSQQFIGNTYRVSGTIGTGAVLLNGTWTNNSNAAYITKIIDISAGSLYVVAQDWSITLDALEPTGIKHGQMSSAITFTT